MPESKSKPKPRRRTKKLTQGKKKSTHAKAWYTIRSILDERVVNGRAEYLVDWEDVGGESFPPNWEPDITEGAKESWEAEKAKARLAQESQSITTSTQESSAPNPPYEDSQESQPPRPANWRHVERAHARDLTRQRSNDETDDPPPRKKIRTDYRLTPPEEPVPSITTASSPETTTEYSYNPGTDAGRVTVELHRPSDFDPGEYQSVTNTQSSQQSSQPLAELEEADRRLVFHSQSSRKTILDSQEPSGQTLSSCYSAAPALAEESNAEERVIPDSQEQSHSICEASVDNASGNVDFGPRTENPSNQALREAVPDSQVVDLDIPSHQPDPNEVQELPTTESTVESGSHSRPRSIGIPHIPPPRYTQQRGSPTFLSQPVLTGPSFTFGDSSPSQTLRPTGSAIELADQASSVDGSQTAESLRESQAAQIVSHDLGSAQTFTQTHVSESSSAQPPQNTSGVSPQRSQEFRLEAGSIASWLAGESSGEMEQSNEEGPVPSLGHRSVADELKQYVDDTFGDLEAANSRTLSLGVPESQYEPVPEALQDSAPPPGPSIQSQPFGQADPWIPEVTINSQPFAEASTNTPRPTATDEIRALVDEAWGADDLISGPPTADPRDIQHTTVSPAEITRHIDVDKGSIPLMPALSSHDVTSSGMYGGTDASITMAQPPIDLGSGESPLAHGDTTPTEHIVTLPFQASMRPLYDDTILDHKHAITDFGKFFSNEVYVPPSEQLVQKIDQLFGQLHNICDYPQDIVGTVFEELPAVQQVRYACDANSKFGFVYELLLGLETESEVLIVARSVELLRLLYNVTEALEVNCRCDAIAKSNNSFAGSVVRVTLELADHEIDASGFTVVVGFDHLFNGSPVAKQLSTRSPTDKSPLVLVLVTTHAIEHIDLQVAVGLAPLERKNALLSGIVQARKLLADPDRGYLEPDKLAKVFFEYLNGQAETILWSPVPVPDELLDVYFSSQVQPEQPTDTTMDPENSRKRKLDDSDDEEAKRMRVLPLEKSTVESNDPPLTDAVRKLLNNAAPAKSPSNPREATVKVAMATLEALAETIAEYERKVADADLDQEYKHVVDTLEKRVKEYERTNAKIYKSHRSALEDRTKIDAERGRVEALLEVTKASAQNDNEKAQIKIAELEATVARLTSGSSTAAAEENPLEAQLKESQDKIQVLEKRLENARQEADYARTMYQEASAAASSVGAENLELKERNAELQKKASDNLVKIHQIQAESSAGQNMRHIGDLKIQVQEREREIDRARDESRLLRNGRRETRQASVPRSPRMGMMSPRTGRGYGGSASRGTSPTPDTAAAVAAALPGMQFLAQQTGNGRWNHLRD